MKKKIFGIRISTILTFLICFLAALLLWFYVDFTNDSNASAAITSGIEKLVL